MNSSPIWTFRNHQFQRGPIPFIMGIVNVTPDSFSDGGQFLDTKHAVEHALELESAGADFLDIGGESTRPGSAIVSVKDELERVLPVIEALSTKTKIPISIDTTKSEVARNCLAAGASIVNDISGLTFDEKMIPLCAETQTGVICMHIQGTPQTMQQEPHYENCVEEVITWLNTRINILVGSGITRESIMIDPGIGFGKTATHNLEILSSISQFHQLKLPILIGHSRKRFLKSILGRDVEERLAGTLGVAIASAEQGADMLRVHDVQAVRDALVAWDTIRSEV